MRLRQILKRKKEKSVIISFLSLKKKGFESKIVQKIIIKANTQRILMKLYNYYKHKLHFNLIIIEIIHNDSYLRTLDL